MIYDHSSSSSFARSAESIVPVTVAAVAAAEERWECKVETRVDQISDGSCEAIIDKLVDSVDCVECYITHTMHRVHGSMANIVDSVHGQVTHTMSSVHGHVPGGVEGVHHPLAQVMSHVHGHVHHVGHGQHAHEVVVGGVLGVITAESRVLVWTWGSTGTMWARLTNIIDLPPQDVPRLTVVTSVESNIKLGGPATQLLTMINNESQIFISANKNNPHNLQIHQIEIDTQ